MTKCEIEVSIIFQPISNLLNIYEMNKYKMDQIQI